MKNRFLVSLVDSEHGWDIAARKAENALKRQAWHVDFITSSTRADFFPTQHSLVERYLLLVHIAHGATYRFLVAGEDDNRVEVCSLGIGRGNLRYLWLLSCNVLRHGRPRGQRPQDFKEKPNERDANVFARWANGLSKGVRLVCGGSTLVFPTEPQFGTVERLLKRHAIADAWIVGVGSTKALPLCAALGRESELGGKPGDNPLFDRGWSEGSVEEPDVMSIQYPLRPLAQKPLATVDRDYTPGTLPIIDLVMWSDAQIYFAEVSESEDSLGQAEIDFDRKTGALHLRWQVDSGSVEDALDPLILLPSAFEGIRDLIDRQENPEMGMGLVKLFSWRHDFIEMRIDQCDEKNLRRIPFRRTQITEHRKGVCVSLNPSLGFAEGEVMLETLDPDVGLLLQLTKDSLGPEAKVFASLTMTGWQYSATREVEVIGAEEAIHRANEILQARVDLKLDDLEDIDRDNPSVSVGYRWRPDLGQAPGCLCPCYVVAFKQRGQSDDDWAPAMVVEVAASPVES